MNKDRRKSLEAIRSRLESLADVVATLRDDIEYIQSDEQQALDNLPDSMADSDRASAMQEAIDAMDSAMSDLDCVDFDEISAALENAINC